ncbi:MAG: polysaccharide biosynthesis C-terminal domain-containing protein [Oscillospiraceae bacterium]|nr:polysaccharide biosynthesis C-terminal domain-containing protein [Oscillospiraceae bacterium]
MLSKVETIINLPIAITAAFSTVLVPTISSLMAKNDMEEANRKLSFSFFIALLIALPAAVGLSVISGPILRMIYPAAPEGALLLTLATIPMVFISLSFVINGGLYGLGKVIVPVISLVIGGAVKLILNIVLISNPNINVYGAVISSIVCQAIAFGICFYILNKHIKLKINIVNNVLKPILAVSVMGIAVWGTHYLMHGFIGNTVATLLSMVLGVCIYAFMIFAVKCLSKEEIYMIPFGTKIYPVLVKMKLYKQESV